MIHATDDLRINSLKPIISPALLMHDLPLPPAAAVVVVNARAEAEAILHGKDDRLLVVVGPCSIHDPEAALEYGAKLSKQAEKLADDLLIIMRVYFEKPRTTHGWKGLINDPHLNESFDINKGLHLARKLLIDLATMHVPAGTEFLDTIIPQYISDTIAWGAIGARTTESQVHRELASGLSMPVGFKNGTNGDIQIAIDAISSSQRPHHFLSVSKMGVPVIVATQGNQTTHVILRGAKSGPNYDATNIKNTLEILAKNNLPPHLMIDCSHGNSSKDYRRQALVVDDLSQQLEAGTTGISGVMIESNLVAGAQTLQPGTQLVRGQSITDACVDWDETVVLLEKLASAVKARRSAQGG